MDNDQVLTYRLPLTWVRIVGVRTELRDELQAGNGGTIECNAVVTTEVGADPLTAIHVSLAAPNNASQKVTWTLTSDGRLSGADVNTTMESLAAWKSGMEAASFVLAAGAPLVAAGPLGWLTLAGSAATAGIVAGTVASRRNIMGDRAVDTDEAAGNTELLDVELGSWAVDSRYSKEFPDVATALANYRAALVAGELAHSRAVLATLKGTPDASERLREIERLMRSVATAGAQAEVAYAAWKQSKITRTTTLFDERVRIDTLPSYAALSAWCASPTGGGIGGNWSRSLRTAVTVDLVSVTGDNGRLPALQFEPVLRRNVVDFRPPRPAVIRVWKLVPSKAGSKFDLEIEQTLHMLVNYPGNETTLQIRRDDSSKAMTASFDENGALTKLTSDDIDPALQRAHDVSALFPAATAAAESGQKFRAALAPPTLSERADELEAATKLGLIPATPDPNQELNKQIELERLRAQLAINRQLATAASPALVVHIEGSLE